MPNYIQPKRLDKSDASIIAQLHKKISFITQVILEILNFQQSCNLIGQQHFGPKLKKETFVKHGICSGKSRIPRIFILECFGEYQMTKSSNAKYLIFGPFSPKVSQNCGALRDLVLFVQFKKHEKRSWRKRSFLFIKAEYSPVLEFN